MTNLPIHTFTGQINNHPVELINAREVHELLQVKTRFDTWIGRRLSETRFRKNLDFIECSNLSNRGFFKTETKEYHLTLRMAEHLCLMENNEIGDRIRDLFIECEEQARNEIPRLQAENAQLNAKLTAIPTFLRNNPDELARLITTAQTAFLTANPQAKDFLRYREMGLSYREIGTLLGKTKDSVKWMAFKMRNLGFFSSTLPKATAVQLDLLA
ncbi:antA/AntB antirepressor family protein [Haemophilus influenzae]|uniref:Phage anti-repressor protein n=3 Tax=Haemophilus TaxID=724 RepID=A0AAV2U5X7_HAEIF|nr:antA/AntB antirepressor family protein [Haemophilus influenzae]QEQ60647.1 phage antirepressor Ant [Haemophilus influenzae biotype aegyptius]CBY87538.1 Putative phage anti-repressor protein [Haemophilus influenzae F3047]